jgi:hypothetical protein
MALPIKSGVDGIKAFQETIPPTGAPRRSFRKRRIPTVIRNCRNSRVTDNPDRNAELPRLRRFQVRAAV